MSSYTIDGVQRALVENDTRAFGESKSVQQTPAEKIAAEKIAAEKAAKEKSTAKQVQEDKVTISNEGMAALNGQFGEIKEAKAYQEKGGTEGFTELQEKQIKELEEKITEKEEEMGEYSGSDSPESKAKLDLLQKELQMLQNQLVTVLDPEE